MPAFMCNTPGSVPGSNSQLWVSATLYSMIKAGRHAYMDRANLCTGWLLSCSQARVWNYGEPFFHLFWLRRQV